VYRIRERHRLIINPNHPHGEFGKVHLIKKWYEVETMTAIPKVIKTFRSFGAAEKWCEKNKCDVGEVI